MTPLAVLEHTITTVYGGDANFAGSTSSPITQTVTISTIWLVVNMNDTGTGDLVAHTGDLRFRMTNTKSGDVIDFNIPGPPVQTITQGKRISNLFWGNGLQKQACFSAGDMAMSLFPGLPRFLPVPPNVKWPGKRGRLF